jgi:hypothetical protein
MHFVRERQDGAPAITFKGDCSPAGPLSKLLGSAGRALVPLQLELNDRVLTHPIERPLWTAIERWNDRVWPKATGPLR